MWILQRNNKGISQRVSLIALFTALSVSTNYLLFPLPNVALMDAIVFSSAAVIDLYVGLSVAILSWLVYGVFNPLGGSYMVIFTAPSELVYVLFAALFRWYLLKLKQNSIFELVSISSLFAFFSTLCYDLITNGVTGLLWYNSIIMGLLTMNFPIPMGIIHEVSNMVLFPVILSLFFKFYGSNNGGENNEI